MRENNEITTADPTQPLKKTQTRKTKRKKQKHCQEKKNSKNKQPKKPQTYLLAGFINETKSKVHNKEPTKERHLAAANLIYDFVWMANSC